MSEQPTPTPGQQSVTDALIAFLRERQDKGIRTYGRSLETFNGRDAVQDALEEALDLAQYLTQWKLERAALLAEVQRLGQIAHDQQLTILDQVRSITHQTVKCEELRAVLEQIANDARWPDSWWDEPVTSVRDFARVALGAVGGK